MSDDVKVGDLLIISRSASKKVRQRVCQVVAVEPSGTWSWVKKYDVRWASGRIEKGVNIHRFRTFDDFRKEAEQVIKAANETINNQYKRISLANEFEKEAKKLFGVGV